ncbi:MAG TPA: SDR family oxidoreductase [Anaeromyxobacteraceae bacterium]|nr:SDR family oxidoreductase [Anaeromyxobacteraceae bacterium]
MSESMQGKVAVMSGAASGFGKATAELFAEKGCGLVLVDVNEDGLARTAARCRELGAKVAALGADATRSETFEQALSECLARWGHVDFLVNYAGGAVKVAPIEEMDDALCARIFELNAMSAIRACRAFAPQFRKQGFGRIVNVSSVCDRRSWPGWSVYSAAKAAVNAFSKCLYTELRPHGVGVTLLVPGGSNTGFQGAARGVPRFEWDEELAVRPEHFADMVYQACALTRGGCVSEMVVIGLAQDIAGF